MKYSYDEKCLDLARYFYPNQSIAFLEALAQAFQDCVEGREDIDDKTLPIPDFLRNQENLRAERAAKETRSEPTVDGALTELRQRLGLETGLGPNGECPNCGGLPGECKPGCQDGSEIL